PEGGRDGLVPQRQEPRHRVFQALGERQFLLAEALIARVVAGKTLVVGSQFRRADVVAAAPDLHLRLAELGRRLGLVQPLQRAVVPLVQAPRAVDRNPHQVHFVLDDPQRADGALQHRSVGHVERVALGLQHQPAVVGFPIAFLGKVHVRPAGEAIFLVPRALAVAHQYQLGHCRNAFLPRNCAAGPSRSSMRSNWLYFEMRSVRLAEPVLIWPALVATARSAMKGSSVSPERCETTAVYPALAAICMVSSVSVTVPIWFSLMRIELAMPWSIPRWKISGLVT